MGENGKPSVQTRLCIAFSMSAVLALAFLQTPRFGLADNGDYTRLMEWIVSKPASFTTNFPLGDSVVVHDRLFWFWLKLWQVDFKPSLISSSSFVYQSTSLIPRFLHGGTSYSLEDLQICGKSSICAILFLAVFAASRHPIFGIYAGLAFSLMLSSFDYVAYLGTFYAEPASSLFFLVTLLAIYGLALKPTLVTITLYLAAVTLLATCKLQNLYLWCLGVGFLLWYLRKEKLLFRRSVALVLTLSFAMTAWPTYSVWKRSSDLGLSNVNAYHRVYHGMLQLSDNPEASLRLIGGSDPACIGSNWFTPPGDQCSQKSPDTYSTASVQKLLLSQPQIIWRMFHAATNAMQDISLEYLGRFEKGDLRDSKVAHLHSDLDSSERRDFYSAYRSPDWNLWSSLKFHIFPRSYILMGYLLASFMLFNSLRGSDPLRGLRYVGIGSIVVCASQIAIAIFGDGYYELIKHLYLANFAFDVSLILAGMAVAVQLRQRFIYKHGFDRGHGGKAIPGL